MGGPIETYLLVGFALSIIASLGGMVVVAMVLVKLPAGYFRSDAAARRPSPNTRPLLRWATVFLRNLVGAALVVLGLIMSIPGIPGPGIVSVVIGLMLLDFAGKKRWATWVMSRPPILRATNSLRGKYGKPPFVMPPP